MAQNIATITKGGLLAKNAFYFLLGQVTPVIVAIFSIPLLINGLGVDRFGALTLAWMVTGCFSLFDLGIARALTKMVSEKLGVGEEQEIPALVWTSIFLVILMGSIGAILVFIVSPYLVQLALKLPPDLHSETLYTLYLLALSIPIVISSVCMSGVLQAYQRFDLISIVRIPVGVLTFLGPLLVLPFSRNLFFIVAILVLVRIAELIANLVLCLYIIPVLRCGIVFQPKLLRPLISFGTWMTVSNIIGPLIIYLDRFLIGSMFSIATVAYYTTPYEMINKLMIIPGALVGVLFPAFGASFAKDRNRTALMFLRGVKYIFLSLFPIILIVVTFAYEGLYFWLGSEFAKNSTHILQWLAVGAFLSSQSYLPFALLHASGRPDLTAKLHFIEAPFYLLIIWLLISSYGIEGAAIAWVVRVVVDLLILFLMAQRLLLFRSPIILKLIGSALCAIILLFISINIPMNMSLKFPFLFVTLLIFFVIGWFLVLAPEERLFACNYLKRFNSSESQR